MENPAHIEFRNLESRLRKDHPKIYGDTITHSQEFVPIHRATPEDIWKALWPKALYVNARQSVGQKWEAALACQMVDAWKHWGADPEVFRIHHIAPGIRNNCFKAEGEQAKHIQETSGISLHRLYKIQSAASVLRNRADIAAFPFDDVNLQDSKGTERHILSLLEEFGRTWGLIPILHFLAEFGESVRPNTHLMRTMNHLRPGRGLPVDSHLNVKQAVKLNHHVWLLMLDLGQPRIQREAIKHMDHMLTAISQCGLLTTQKKIAEGKEY